MLKGIVMAALEREEEGGMLEDVEADGGGPLTLTPTISP